MINISLKYYKLIGVLLLGLLQSACVVNSGPLDSSKYPEVWDRPLIQIANLEYEGAFILSSSEFGFSTMHDAEGGMAYATPKSTAPRGSLFATGNFARGGVSEWAIPPLVDSKNVADLNIVNQPLQTFSDISDRAKNRRAELGYFGDLLWLDNQLLYTEHNYYPASNLDLHKMGVLREADDLEESSAGGYFRINAASGEERRDSYTASASSGWMSEIPKEWQSFLGGTHLLGPADGWNVEGRFAAGPSVFAFNPRTDVLLSEPDGTLDSVALVDYSTEQPITQIGIVGGPYINAPNDLWNSMSFVHFGFIPKGSRTLVLLGKQWGMNNDIGYKITQDNGVLCGGPCPFESDDQANYYWLIDLRDVLSAQNGNRRFDSIVPYSYGILPLPFQKDIAGNARVNDLRGGAYDVDSGTVYLQIKGGDPRPTYELRPVIAAYSFNTSRQYEVPQKVVWKSVDGKQVDSTDAPTVNVSCQECDSQSIKVSWEIPSQSVDGSQIDVNYFRLTFENLDLGYYNTKRHQRIGTTVSGYESTHIQKLSPGNWRISIRAISSDGVPSML